MDGAFQCVSAVITARPISEVEQRRALLVLGSETLQKQRVGLIKPAGAGEDSSTHGNFLDQNCRDFAQKRGTRCSQGSLLQQIPSPELPMALLGMASYRLIQGLAKLPALQPHGSAKDFDWLVPE